MNRNLGKALISVSLAGVAVLAAATLAGCSEEDPAPGPGMQATANNAAVTNNTAAGPVTGGTATSDTSGGATVAGATVTTGAATVTTGGATTSPSTTAATAGSSTATTGSSAATTSGTTGGATTTTAATSTAATGAGGAGSTTTDSTTGAQLTDEQCSGIGNGDACTTPGMCAPRPCGIADTGTRTCTCSTTWDCTSCSWTEPYSPYAEPPTEALPTCDAAVEDEVACTGSEPRCLQGDELCVCWVEEGNIWDCDSQPSFWP